MVAYTTLPTVLINLHSNNRRIQAGILSESRKLGWRLLDLAYTSFQIPKAIHPIGAVISSKTTEDTQARLKALDIPIVYQGLYDPNFEEYPNVLFGAEEGGVLAAKNFFERGFREFFYIGYAGEVHLNYFTTGFIDTVHGLPGSNLHELILDPFNITRMSSLERYKRYVELIHFKLLQLPRPLAVVVPTTQMGTRLITSCELAGLKIPEDIAIICQGDDPIVCETVPVPLSAVDMNDEEVGAEALRYMKKLIDDQTPSKEPVIVPPVGLIERRSTDILAVPDARVAQAIRFIWDHLDWPLTLDDVARQVGVSRTTIARLFKENLGRGVNSELRRRRLERCKELLRGTKMTVQEISEAVGLNDKRQLHRAFRDAFGETPRQYRTR